ncbi:Transposase DDE domain-containing protein [Mesorhizobium muleiense]|uniref:Transposase DDE domain-containing protein n=1 Tax=Mesorhizobium muleiense TaxID=1004279 RepID=A0A1G9EVN3_9HYPH|nr:Transposase DDE domain-containing protein [Mesorhizobium muleiense]
MRSSSGRCSSNPIPPTFRTVTAATNITVEIVMNQVGFVVLPRRWVVERFFAWINRNRRLAKNFESTINSAAAFLYAASVMLLVRRMARAP